MTKYFQIATGDYDMVTKSFWFLLWHFECPEVPVCGKSTRNGMELSLSVQYQKWEVVLESALVLLETIPYRITTVSEVARGWGD